MQKLPVRQQQDHAGDEGVGKVKGIHHLQDRVHIFRLLLCNQLGHGRKEHLVVFQRAVIILGQPLGGGGQLVKRMLGHFFTGRSGAQEDGTGQHGDGQQRHHHEYAALLFAFHMPSYCWIWICSRR